MVNVRLVEKRVNKTVGRVIVVRVIIQYRMLGNTRAITSIKRPSSPSHELDGEVLGASASPEACEGGLLAAVLVAMLRREFRPFEAVEDQFPLGAVSMAISASEFHHITPHVRRCDGLREPLLVCIVEVRKRRC